MATHRTLAVSCLCGAATHSFSVPISSLPLPTHLCSCNISRRISGGLLTSYVHITFDPAAPSPDLSALTPYESSNILTRYFCSNCGTHMYLKYKHDGHFEAATGTLQVESTDGIVDYKAHIWIGDTIDGGASQFLPEINGHVLPRFLQEPDPDYKNTLPINYRGDSAKPEGTNEDKLHAHCHCRGVEFWISRPTEASRKATTSPYPDLTVPFNSGEDPANPSNEPWWIPHPNRFLAGTCTCISCRRSLGFDITFWAFVPAANISKDPHGTQPFQRNPYWGTMKEYRSTNDVPRTFCRVCGANVFWNGDVRPTLVDVAVGLLDAHSGTRAQDWLAWWSNRVSFEEEALNKGLVKGLKNGMTSWAEQHSSAEFLASRKV